MHIFHLMKYFFVCLLMLAFGTTFCQENTLADLNKVINQSATFDQIKQKEIAAIKKANNAAPLTGLFDKYLIMYNEYKVFNYDSAYTYALRLLNIAKQENNDSLYHIAKIRQSFVLLSSGMFKEAFDSLNTINSKNLSRSLKAEFFTLTARCYYDLADYDNDKYHAPAYNRIGSEYLDSALQYYPLHSFNWLYYNGLKEIRSEHIENAFKYFNSLMADTSLKPHQLALTASTLSDIYIQKGEPDSAVQLLIRAAIADIKTSTKETTAIFNLSTLLFKQGDLKNASFYIKKAMNDAVFYGAKQRKVQLSAILYLIEGEKIARVESENKKAISYAIGATLFIVLLGGLIITILYQIKKIKLAKQTISLAHRKQQEINAKLEEANKIKEEYLGYFFNGNSEVYSKIERFKKNIEKKIITRRFDEINGLLYNFNLKQDKQELLNNFDRIFLKLFPNFITAFNCFFKEEDQIIAKDSSTLNTDLRIFALIRLGIHDNEKIAEILGYSFHTINTYKTKIKNKSLVPNEEFEHKIMEIKSV